MGFTIINPDRDRIGVLMAKHGLKAIKDGMRLNTAYTPKRCREVIERATGMKFKARDYDGMIQTAERYLEETNPNNLGEQGVPTHG